MRAHVLFLLLLTQMPRLWAGNYPVGPGTAPQGFDFPDGTVDLGDGSEMGNDIRPGIDGPVTMVRNASLLLIRREITNTVGSFKLPDIDPGRVVRTFDARFNLAMATNATDAPGKGWSVSFGQLPPDNGTGETGFLPLRHGLTIGFDTSVEGDGLSSIRVVADGVTLAEVPRAFSFDGAQRAVVVKWDEAGLDLVYENRAIVTDLPLPGFAPNAGWRFGFSARSQEGAMTVLLDGLRVTTATVPVIETGGPVISEFVAVNSRFEDEFTDASDWLEILNGSTNVVDLSGWYLTDSAKDLRKWRIEGLRLNPYNYQVVFASGRDLQGTTSSSFHANFQLSRNGGYLGLVMPDGRTVASSYTYGPQSPDVAFGESGQGRTRGYLFPATPGGANSGSPQPNSRASGVTFSHPGGFVFEALEIAISATTSEDGQIRYTTDRTEPGPESAIYQGPIPVSGFTMLRARLFRPGYVPGPVSSATYVFPDATMTNLGGTGKPFESNIPFLFIDSFGSAVDSGSGGLRPFRPGYVVVMSPDGTPARSRLAGKPEYAGPCGVHLRGESSAGFDQKSYALELRDENGDDLDVSLLGMPADSDWVLYGPWSEKSLMRNKLVFDWMRQLRGEDGSSPRCEFVELFFNQTKPANGRIGYSTYKGIYVLMEKLKRGRDRVPIENLNGSSTSPQLITGGYIIRKDKEDSFKNNWVSGSLGIPLQSFDPDRLNPIQLNYIKKFTSDVDRTLMSSGFRNVETGYRAYMDPDTFIDFQWFTEIAKQVDGYVFSSYYHKNRDGRLRAGPLWDFNISLGNADYGSGDYPTGWLYDGQGGVGQLWFPRLHADPDHRLAHWDRYWQMRRSFLNTEAIQATTTAIYQTLTDGYSGGISNRTPADVQNPAARHFRRWPRLGSRDWPNPPASSRMRTWLGEIDYMRAWLSNRLVWLDDQSLKTGRTVLGPPRFESSIDVARGGIQVRLKPYSGNGTNTIYPEGNLYYTTDGTDPRLPSGAISEAARRYVKPLVFADATVLRVRMQNQNQWSPISAFTHRGAARPASKGRIHVTEVLYRPAIPDSKETRALLSDDSQFEFVELQNRSDGAVDLSGLSFTGGIRFSCTHLPPEACLLPRGEFVILVSDRRAFSLRYPNVPAHKILGEFRGRLGDRSDAFELTDGEGSLIERIEYADRATANVVWNGAGHSAVWRPGIRRGETNHLAGWGYSLNPGGNPGVSGVLPGELPYREDSDGDGYDNVMEWYAGSDALNPNSVSPIRGAISRISVNGTEDLYLTFTFRRAAEADWARAELVASESPGAWEPAGNDWVLHQSVSDPDGTIRETFRSAMPWDGRTRFVSLRVSVNPL